jgi:hypothetical protein
MNLKKQGEREEVRKSLHEAFPSLIERRDLTPLTHEECVDMRSRLPSLSESDLPFFLVQVLEDLLDNPPGRFSDARDAEAVVQWLDVSRRGTDLLSIEEVYGKEGLKKAVNDEIYLHQASEEAFGSFTAQQASAICRWLEHIKAWREMKWYEKYIGSALAYWRTRSE